MILTYQSSISSKFEFLPIVNLGYLNFHLDEIVLKTTATAFKPFWENRNIT